MDPELRRIEWHEETTGRSFHARFRARSGPGCSIVAALIGAPVLLFLILVGPRSAGGGLIPALGVLQMALPLAIVGFLALREDRDGFKMKQILLDREELRSLDAEGGEKRVAAADIAAFEVSGSLVEARDRQGQALLHLHVGAPTFVCRRLNAALEQARAPLTYRS
jgi:hypothetical protein